MLPVSERERPVRDFATVDLDLDMASAPRHRGSSPRLEGTSSYVLEHTLLPLLLLRLCEGGHVVDGILPQLLLLSLGLDSVGSEHRKTKMAKR